MIRFRREAAAVAKFRHPNIVAAIESGETHGLLFLVMEFVNGRDLSRTVKEKGPLSVVQTIDCIIQAARGLQEAHDHGIVHRDIKPANLLLDPTGTVKVLDLGLARVNQPDEFIAAGGSELDLTVSGSIVGTVDYMSPEQAYDPRMADGRSDIYSLGCTLHYLLTGKAPFGGQTFMERLLGHRERPFRLCLHPGATFPQLSMPRSSRSWPSRPKTGRKPWRPSSASSRDAGKPPERKPSRPLMVFDDRDEEDPRAASRLIKLQKPKRDSPAAEIRSHVECLRAGAERRA